MNDHKKVCPERTDFTQIEANICYSRGTCGRCHWFDSNYHGGYCDKHRVDMQSYSPSCDDYWEDR